jgi:NAD(P)-dependent dehydrogenase (short-subunit alcohol dehydrogenase family)
VTADRRELSRHFFTATVALATHTGSLQERLADAYADHLLPVVASDLPAELQPVFREVEDRMTAVEEAAGDDPFRTAAEQLSDDQARALIERIVALFGRLSVPVAK